MGGYNQIYFRPWNSRSEQQFNPRNSEALLDKEQLRLFTLNTAQGFFDGLRKSLAHQLVVQSILYAICKEEKKVIGIVIPSSMRQDQFPALVKKIVNRNSLLACIIVYDTYAHVFGSGIRNGILVSAWATCFGDKGIQAEQYAFTNSGLLTHRYDVDKDFMIWVSSLFDGLETKLER